MEKIYNGIPKEVNVTKTKDITAGEIVDGNIKIEGQEYILNFFRSAQAKGCDFLISGIKDE